MTLYGLVTDEYNPLIYTHIERTVENKLIEQNIVLTRSYLSIITTLDDRHL